MFSSIPKLSRRVFHMSPREFRLVLGVCILFLGAALVYVWPNVEMVNLAYEFQTEKRLNQDLLHENVLLKLERDSLQSLERVQYLAESRLGMQEPQPGQRVTILIK